MLSTLVVDSPECIFHFQHIVQIHGFDASFFHFTLKVLRQIKFYYVLGYRFVIVVVSTSSAVWSEVRLFFLLEYIFCTINHDEQKNLFGYL